MDFLSRSNNKGKQRADGERQPSLERLWYRRPSSQHPYQFAALSRAPTVSLRSTTFRNIVFFPWEEQASIDFQLEADGRQKWRRVANKWKNVFILCGGREVRILKLTPDGKMKYLYNIRTDFIFRKESEEIRAACWSIDPDTLEPLIVLGGKLPIVYVFNAVTRELTSCIRGHGGSIASMTSHSTKPHLVASTSRDRSVRIYDLSIPADAPLLEAHWPTLSSGVIAAQEEERQLGLADRGPNQPLILPSGPTKIGPPFGGAVKDEVIGKGRCIVLLRGQSVGTGGHDDAVLGAAFHPRLPIIATCGLDNSVKIWKLPSICDPAGGQIPNTLLSLRVEDCPLFSASTIHDSRVSSIDWLSEDTLVSKSSGNDPAGTIAIWKWLEISRFFPAEELWGKILTRSTSSDYDESRSYKVLSKFAIPLSSGDSFKLSLHRGSGGKCLVAIGTTTNKAIMWNPSLAQPRIPQPAPEDHIPKAPQFMVNQNDNDADDGDDIDERVLRKRRRVASPTISEMDLVNEQRQLDQTAFDEDWDMQRQPAWVLEPPESIGFRDRDGIQEGWLELQAVAISPFGAEWVVAGGCGEMVCVWRGRSP